MKSIRSAIGVAMLGSLALVSCKKDYTCTCNLNGEYYIHYLYTNMEESGAQAACAADEALLEQETGQNLDCTI